MYHVFLFILRWIFGKTLVLSKGFYKEDTEMIQFLPLWAMRKPDLIRALLLKSYRTQYFLCLTSKLWDHLNSLGKPKEDNYPFVTLASAENCQISNTNFPYPDNWLTPGWLWQVGDWSNKYHAYNHWNVECLHPLCF